MTEHRITSFGEFWPYYLREHAKPETRALHYIGTTIVVALFVWAMVSGQWMLLWLMPVAGYGFCLGGAFSRGGKTVRPLSNTHSGRSSAISKCGPIGLTGQLGKELDRAGVR